MLKEVAAWKPKQADPNAAVAEFEKAANMAREKLEYHRDQMHKFEGQRREAVAKLMSLSQTCGRYKGLLGQVARHERMVLEEAALKSG